MIKFVHLSVHLDCRKVVQSIFTQLQSQSVDCKFLKWTHER